MRNCLVLGSGRSGTSMVGGVLAQAGYFMGDHLWPGEVGNPKGFFEDQEVNTVNEEILAQVTPKRPNWPRRPWKLKHALWAHRPIHMQRWLSCVPVAAVIPSTSTIELRIQRLTAREPYCFKDPRFSYTLPTWRPFLRNTVFVCVFRDPSVTARSILKECADAEYLREFRINYQRAVNVWVLMYSHILERHVLEGEWLFIHYNQILTGDGMDRLEKFLGVPVDRSFPDASLQRTLPEGTTPRRARLLYKRLCAHAQYVG